MILNQIDTYVVCLDMYCTIYLLECTVYILYHTNDTIVGK